MAGAATLLVVSFANLAAAQAPCTSPTLDSDGDGIPDVEDNCILVPNSNQRDTSGAGIGNACNPDLNHDGIVNTLDLNLFKEAMLAYNSAAHTYNPNADFNGDGVIDSKDLAILVSFLGKPPGPSAGLPAIQVAPTTLNFGAPFVGVATTLPVTLTNAGCRPVQILSATITGNAAFQIFPPTTMTLTSAGQGATLNVGFLPTSAGSVNATLTLVTNAGGGTGTTYLISLLGTGVMPTPAQVPTLVAPSNLAFPSVSTGSSATQSLAISNSGTAPLVITGIQPNSSLFSVDASLLGGFPLTIAPTASDSLPVQLTAGASPGAVTGTLQIANNDPLRSNASVGLQGLIVAAPVVPNNPVTGAEVFDGQTPITATNCASVTRAVTFGAGTNSGDQYQVILTNAAGASLASASFPVPSSPGTQVLSGVNACGLGDGPISVSVVYTAPGGGTAPTFVGTPATKDTSTVLSPPTLTPPSAPYFTSSTANICGTARASTTVIINGGTTPVSATLDSATTTFCLTVPLMPNQQNTLVATAIDDTGAAPRASASSTPLLVTQVNPSQIVIASATSTPLNAVQIATLVANGVINLQNPANFNVSIFTIVLTIGSFPVTITQPVATPILTPVMGAGGAIAPPIITSAGSGWTSSKPIPVSTVPVFGCTESCATIVPIQPPVGPVIPGVLIIDGTIKTLKEFFQVTLAIQNTSSAFTLTDVASSLSLPTGSLTAVSAGVGTNVGTTGTAAASSISLGSIVPGATGTGQFIIRGDAIGIYGLDVQFNGFITGAGLANGGIAFNGSAGTSVQVSGPPSLSVTVQYPHPPGSSYDVVAGQTFTLTVDITNTSTQPALYPSLDLVVGGNETLIDPTTNLPVAQELTSLPNIAPGQTVSSSFLVKSSAQGYVIACQGLSSSNVSVSVDIQGDANAGCNIANTLPAAFLPPSPNSPPTVLGISPGNGQGAQPVTTSVVADLTPLSACLTADAFANVVTAPINPSNPSAGIQVTSADLATPGTFYVEELDANGNSVRHVPVQLVSVTGATGATTVATLRLGLATPLSQYFLKSLTNYRVTLVGADRSAVAGGAVCNASNQTPLAQTYQWTFQTALSCTNDAAPVATLSEPANGSTSQLVNTPIVVNFTNFINGSTFKVDPENALNDSFAVFAGALESGGDVSGGTLVPGSVNLTNQGKTLTFTPAGNLPYSTQIVVRLANSLDDACGTPLSTAANGVQLFSFQTAAAPVAPPAPPTVNPVPTLTNLSSISVTGMAPVGTTVTITGGAQTVSGLTGGGGLFSLSVPLTSNAKNSLAVTATDTAGNVSPSVTTDINGAALIVQSDQTAPTVIASVPVNAATGVAVSSAISVTFSEAINVGTANALNVQLSTGGLPVAGSVAASGAGLTFTPAAALNPGEQYQLTLRAGGISDLAGNSLASASTISFTTAAAKATLTSVTPATGVAGTPVSVTFIGTNLSGTTAISSANAGIGGALGTVSATTVTANVTIAATATVGVTTLGLNVGGQIVTLPFTVTAPPPTLTSISPSSGTVGTVVTVTFTGTNLSAATAVTSSNASVSGAIVGTPTSTSVTASVTISASAAAGATSSLGLVVGGQSTAALTFMVLAATPSLTSITLPGGSAGSATVGTNVSVTFTGTNLSKATAVISGNSGVTGTITSVSATSVVASVTVAANATPGVTTLGLVIGGANFTLPFTVVAATPTITSLSPATGAQGQSALPVTITGTNLLGITSISVTGVGSGVTAALIAGGTSSTTQTANFTIPSTATPGAYTVTVITAAGKATASFTVTSAAPTITSLSPAIGAQGQSALPVTITGTNLLGITSISVTGVGSGVTAALIAGGTSSTTQTANFTIPSTATPGAYTVTVITAAGTATAAFTVTTPAPTISLLSPSAGEQGHSVAVTINGTNLLNITQITVSGGGVTASVAAGGTASAQTANFVIAGTAATGTRTVSVTTAAGVATAAFTVNAAPTLSVSLTPNPLTLSTESTTSLTVTLSDLAPTGGQVINLTTGAGLVGITPASVTIPQNQSTATTAVTITSTATTGSDIITASGTGVTSGTDAVQVQARGFSLNAGLVGLSRTATGVITLNQPAPSGGATIALSVANTSLVTVSPSSVTIPSGQTTATFSLVGGSSIGATILTANGAATGFVTQTAPLTITNLLLNLSTAQTLGFGQSGSYQVQIAPNAAGAGGVVVNLASSNTNVATVPATVTIPSGAFSANFSVQAGTTATGVSTISASNASFAPTTTTVNVTAALLLAETSKTLSSTQADTVDFQLTSGGSPYSAAASVAVTGVSSDSTCVTVTSSPVAVAAGQSFGSLPIAYGGTATLPCVATVTLNNALFGSAAIPVTFQASSNGGKVTLGTVSSGLGAGLQSALSVGLTAAAPTGGAIVEVRSSNPAALLVSSGATVPGAPAVNVTFAAGATSATIYVQGVAGATGTVTLTGTSSKYTAGTSAVSVVTSVVGFVNDPAATMTRLTAPSAFSVGLYAFNGTSYFSQAVSPSTGAVTVTVSNSAAAVGQLEAGSTTAQSVTLQIPVNATSSGYGATSGGGSFAPLAPGSTTLTVSATNFATAAAASYGTQAIVVTGAGMTLSAGNAATGSGAGLGAGLQLQQGSISLTAPAPAGGVTIQVASSAPGVLLLAPVVSGAANGTTVGVATINVAIPAGSSSASFWLQGVAAGTSNLSATDAADNDYSAAAPVGVSVVTSVVGFVNDPAATMTRLTAPSAFSVGLYAFNGTSYFSQAVSPSTGAVTVTVSNSAAAVGQLEAGSTTAQSVTLQIPVNATSSGYGAASGGGSFAPLAPGSTTLTVSATNFATAAAASYGTQAIVVTGAGMTLSAGNAATGSGAGLGAGLQLQQGSISLTAPAPAGGVTIQVASSAPGVLLLAPVVSGAANGTTVGVATINVAIPAGSSSASFWLQGVAAGTSNLSATDAADNDYSAAAPVGVSVVTSVVGFVNDPAATMTRLTAPSAFSVGLYAFNGTSYFSQAVSPSTGAVTVTVSNSAAAVGQLEAGSTTAQSVTLQIPVNATSSGYGATSGGGSFAPLADGSTVLTVSATNFATAAAASYGTQAIVVTGAGMTLSAGNAATGSGAGLGAGLQLQQGSISLTAPAPAGGVTIQVASSAPGVLLLAPVVSGAANGTTVGVATINVAIPAGSSSASFWLQGVAAGTSNLSATDAADNDYSAAAPVGVSVVTSVVGFVNNPPSTTTTVSAPSAFSVGAYAFNGTSYFSQAVSPSTGAVTVTVSNSAAAVGQLEAGSTTAQSVTLQIPVNATSSGYGAASGGGSFAPLADGSTVLTVSATNFATAAAANYGTQVIAVTMSALSFQSGVQVGSGLQYPMTGTLQAANDGGVTIKIASGDTTKLLVSPDAVTPGTPFINVFVANNTTSYTFYVQGIAGATGSVTLTASTTDTQFTTGTIMVPVVEAQLVFYTGLPTSESATSADTPFEIAMYVPGYTYEDVSAGVGSLVVTLSSSNTAAASLTTTAAARTSPVTVTLSAGEDMSPSTVAGGGVALHAVAAGATNITATAPGTLSAAQTVTLN